MIKSQNEIHLWMVDPLYSLHPCQYYGWITAYHFKYVVESVAGQILDISME